MIEDSDLDKVNNKREDNNPDRFDKVNHEDGSYQGKGKERGDLYKVNNENIST